MLEDIAKNSSYFCNKMKLSVRRPIFFLCLILTFSVKALSQNTIPANLVDDSIAKKNLIVTKDTSVDTFKTEKLNNKILNTTSEPLWLVNTLKKQNNEDILFYIILALILILAFLKYFNLRYVNNLFRVFFNTSLRQSQLTDQLLQSGLTSLLFNVFYVLSAGLFLYLILDKSNLINEKNNLFFLPITISMVAVVYIVKFCTLKFTGWITGLINLTDTYLFVIFLFNKIMGIFLIPFIVLIAFAVGDIAHIATIVAGLSVSLFLILRFFRSYSLLQQQLKLSTFHFTLYILGVEILPLLVMYKGLMIYLTKNL